MTMKTVLTQIHSDDELSLDYRLLQLKSKEVWELFLKMLDNPSIAKQNLLSEFIKI